MCQTLNKQDAPLLLPSGKDPESLFSKYLSGMVCSKAELLILADEAETKGKEV